jgi:alpha-beta hydrolase superfamily lysophospholipase
MQAPTESAPSAESTKAETSGDALESRNLHFQSKDGTALFATLYPTSAKEALANALIIHGYADHGGRYEEVARTLNAAGLNALSVDLRGHGRSDGDRGFIEKFEQYLEDVEAALAQLSEHCGDRDVLLLGHSNGGLIALRLLADPFRCPKSIKAGVISSPFLALKIKAPVKVMLAKVTTRILPKLSMPNNIESAHLSHDPEKIREHEHDTLCHDVASTRWFTEATAAQHWVEEFAHRVAVPTLWLVSGMDKLADADQTRKVHTRVSSESSYHEFPEMHHEVFNEIDRASVFKLLTDFCVQKFHVKD